MAKPRRRQEYTPALLENLRFRFEQTDEPIVAIAASISRSHTTLRLLAREQGWTKFVPPPLDLSPAAKLAADAEMLAAEAEKLAEGGEAARHGTSSTFPPRSGGERSLGVREHDEARWGVSAEIEKAEGAKNAAPPTATSDPSPPLAEPAGGGEKDVDLSNLAPDARMARLSEMARGLDIQLAVLRRKQAYPQDGEDTKAINADVKSLAATCAVIEHQIEKLEGRRSTPVPDNSHDDISEDIDTFRLRLAARIEAFLERRPDIGDDHADEGRGRDPVGS